MAIGQMEFYSQELRRNVNFRFILSNDAPDYVVRGNDNYKRGMKTLFLLHGYNDASSSWILNSPVMDLAMRYHLCIILPEGENSFYLDGEETGRHYASYIGNELLEYTRKTFHISEKREDTMVGGYSMGGFGAVHTAFRYPDNFSGVFALSSALIVDEFERKAAEMGNEVANYAYYKMVFGDPEKVLKSENNPKILLERLKKDGINIPKIYMACGTEDFLLHSNREMRDFLMEKEVPCRYEEDEGSHDFGFWNKHLASAVAWLL